MSRDSKARRDAARKREKAKPKPLDRRTIIHNAIRAGERAALSGQPMVTPEIYAGDNGQTVAWTVGYRNAKLGERPC